ncbi:aquaporin [Rhodobacteraceae bacterium RKSG542]|uniref:MIP/aquaporin family protein n=1 Tax=Pseudovibrio flavus TaxID=2529854 RepID=UPI00352782F6|nr:aquaporin [Pseudovibrio flavus]
MPNREKLKNLTQACLAEFIGTALFLFLGIGALCASFLAGVQLSHWEVALIWGLAVTIAIYLTSGTSGAHLNPAVTIALFTFGGFQRHKVLPYIASQLLGALFGAAIVYAIYQGLFLEWELQNGVVRSNPEAMASAALFGTFPHKSLSVSGAFIVEFLITCILMGMILAITDERNGAAKGALAPLLIGVVVAVIGAATGPLTGFAMNPARDFGPKLFMALNGWGAQVFYDGAGSLYLWVPIVAPIAGALTGALLYRFMRGQVRVGASAAEIVAGKTA